MEKFLFYLYKNNYSKNTIYAYKSSLNKYLKYINHKINKNSTKEYIIYLIHNYEPASVEFHKQVLIKYLKYLKIKWINIINEIRTPKINRKLFKIINYYDFNKILKTVKHKTHYQLFQLLYFTGIRISEIKKSSIQNNNLLVNGKGNKIRTVPLIFNLTKEEHHVLKAISRHNVYKYIHLYFDSWVTPHTFRRSFCTHLSKEGANIKIIQKLMGHSKLETTASYMHFNENDIKKEINKYF
ncbi:tyrosine-type recombinase/integrase [Spiroplasma endosymbiont of Amphibalanus improvisus]|uniref:tyrosine-type recombinase/integrase n=1 Tax=Spiroplasma endosymbiont of Amphibalanus improvisus TaxID=3066327 RepID=UPI00313D25C4